MGLEIGDLDDEKLMCYNLICTTNSKYDCWYCSQRGEKMWNGFNYLYTTDSDDVWYNFTR